MWLCFPSVPNTESLLWVSHPSHVPGSLLISSSFPCNRSFGDRKNSSFLFRLNCLLCLINSSMAISVFVGQDNIQIQKLCFQQWLNSKLFTKLSLAFVIYPTKRLFWPFSYPEGTHRSQRIVSIWAPETFKFPLWKWKGRSVTVSVCDKQKENDGRQVKFQNIRKI